MSYFHRLEIGMSSFDGKSILSVDFYILPQWADYLDDAVLSGRIDWQDDITIWQSECIEVDELMNIMNYLNDRIVPECVELLGENWKLGHPTLQETK